MRIGIFDTGHGGALVAGRLRKALPEHDYLVVDDSEFRPYGHRSQMAIAHLTDRAIQSLLINDCEVIVLACGASTAAALSYLRGRYPDRVFIGFEPLLQPATSLSHARRISVFAAPSTLKSDLYRAQLKGHSQDIAVHHPDCRDWIGPLEQGLIPDNFDDVIEEIALHGSDVILLLCTHTLSLQETLAARTGLRVIEPTSVIARSIADIAKRKSRTTTADRATVRATPAQRPAVRDTRKVS